MIDKNKQLGISFDPYVMEQLFALASTREYGSVHTIVKKAVNQFLKTVNSTSVKDSHNDRSSN
ncbi:hypothetical protein D6I78_02540 [Escherichia coli]|uniref:hypothetical protein n=1 Tax=Escherichia coli TaxID=562 RepID=UPI0010B240CE|nr:hypothetical protein [Escherichia coli]EEW7958531.1 hypothetical protein [Escherichia coli]EFO1167061.1 hypothetical protein [Escherichia coli]EHE8691721.1 hypothetical protein [Escherichia coli]GCG63207.1 hypothetical protein BvCms19BK_02870 [Escherichia coli]